MIHKSPLYITLILFFFCTNLLFSQSKKESLPMFGIEGGIPLGPSDESRHNGLVNAFANFNISNNNKVYLTLEAGKLFTNKEAMENDDFLVFVGITYKLVDFNQGSIGIKGGGSLDINKEAAIVAPSIGVNFNYYITRNVGTLIYVKYPIIRKAFHDKYSYFPFAGVGISFKLK